MMKTCEQMQEACLLRPDSPEVAAHLAGCPACRAFSEFQQLCLNTPEPDFATPSLADIRRRIAFGRQRRRFRQFALGTAAVAAIGVSVFVFGEKPETLPEPGPSAAVSGQFAAAPSGESVPSLTTAVAEAAAGVAEETPEFTWDRAAELNRLQLRLADIRQDARWSINEFNPVNQEDL